jgi:hypothetical protein
MQATATTMTLLAVPVLAWWADARCDWTPGPGRKFGPPHVDLFGDGHHFIGNAGPAPEQGALLNVRAEAERLQRGIERVTIDFVITRYRYYRVHHSDLAPFTCKAAVARDAGLPLERVSCILSETYALVG